jgi:hypothetical protein
MSQNAHEKIEQRVREVKGFYINLTVYIAVFIGCIVAWMAMGGGAFWPIWVLLGCGVAAFAEGLRLGMLPILSEILPFLRDDWEETKKKELMKKISKEDDGAPKKKKGEAA